MSVMLLCIAPSADVSTVRMLTSDIISHISTLDICIAPAAGCMPCGSPWLNSVLPTIPACIACCCCMV
jgi:hypothetical protein